MNDLEARRLGLHKVRRQILASDMTKLFPRELDVLNLRYGLVDNTYRDHEAIANFYGMSLQRVKAIEIKALSRLFDPDKSPPPQRATRRRRQEVIAPQEQY